MFLKKIDWFYVTRTNFSLVFETQPITLCIFTRVQMSSTIVPTYVKSNAE